MDEETLRAMAQWPGVPDVAGWMFLDRRGRWFLKGQEVTHPLSKAFIQRNYQCSSDGRPYFQNGPQRVWVTCELCPWIYRWLGPDQWRTHTGVEVTEVRQVLVDPEGNLFLVTEFGLGLIHEQDLLEYDHYLCKPSGSNLDDEALAAFMAGSAARLGFRWSGRVLPIEEFKPDL